jgi:hypothetical protein
VHRLGEQQYIATPRFHASQSLLLLPSLSLLEPTYFTLPFCVREKSTQHIRIVSLNLSDAIDFERRSREARLASMNPSFVQAHPYNLRSEGEGSSRRAGSDKGRMVLHSIVHGASGLPGSVLSRYI